MRMFTLPEEAVKRGFLLRSLPLPLSKLIRSGVTTVGGLLGTDGVTRHVDAVLAKAELP